MLMARVELKEDFGTRSSPGIGARASALVAPHRKCRRRTSGAVANRGSATRTSRSAGPSGCFVIPLPGWSIAGIRRADLADKSQPARGRAEPHGLTP